MKKNYILDTNVFLVDAKSIFSYGNNDIIIPSIVLDEIDKHKKRPDSVGLNARASVRILDGLREKGSLYSGIKLGKGMGFVYVKNPDLSLLPKAFDASNPDHQILAVALTEKATNFSKKTILVSCDIGLRVKCDSLNIATEDYISDHAIKQATQMYTGFSSVLVDEQVIDKFYNKQSVFPSELDFKQKVYPNEFLMLISNSNDKKSAIARFINQNSPLKKIDEFESTWGGIVAKNKEQAFALDLLMDPNIPIVSMIGRSGCGKTLLALAAGLQQIIPYQKGNKNRNKPTYNRLIVSRPIQPMGRDIGFLPGDINEKMMPWLSPIQDNLRFLFGDDQLMLSEYMDKNIIEIEALTYIRGRSIQNAYILIDEIQNTNRHEIKTIMTRVGNGSKIVLTGDIEQIDNLNVDETSNGLTHVVEKMKNEEIAGHITLLKGERSIVASRSAAIL